MLYSENLERSRRFKLALRMGIPILLLIGAVLVSIFRQNKFQINEIDIILFVTILLVSVYFLFFLINTGLSETYIDKMTGVFNRNQFLEILEKEMQKSPSYSIILMRVENLSSINDHYGIDKGDEFLRILIHILNDFLQLNGIKDPIIGRYHGGDFLIGLPLQSQKSFSLIEEFANTYKEIKNITIELFYVDVDKEEIADPKQLVTYLYDMLSLSKKEVKSIHKQKRRVNLDTIEKEIVEAIEQDTLKLHFVPSFNLLHNRIDLFEVGVRLVIQSGNTLPPKKFIPIINRLGLETRFDEMVFLNIYKLSQKVKDDIRFSFNISPFSLRKESFYRRILDVVSSKRVEEGRLIIQLFENRPCKDIAYYRFLLEELQISGIRFALDHFGSQNAGMEYIKKLPINMVKFDSEFTTFYKSPRIEALMEGYLQALHAMKIETLAKWVDTEEMKERLRQLGVDYIQGFIVADRVLDEKELIKQYGGNNEIR